MLRRKGIDDVQSPVVSSGPFSSEPSSATFEAVYRVHYRDLVRLAARVIRDTSSAEEVVQSVFENVFVRWSELDGLPWLVPYLRRAVLNGSLMHLRRIRRQQRHSQYDILSDSTDLGEGMDRTDLVAQVRHAMRDLPERQRQCLDARFVDGLREGSVARQLSISVGSVRTHTRRGLSGVRGRFERDTAHAGPLAVRPPAHSGPLAVGPVAHGRLEQDTARAQTLGDRPAAHRPGR